MDTSYQVACLEFNADQIEQIEKKLKEWSVFSKTGLRISKNIRQSEHFLPKNAMTEILQVIFDNVDSDIPALEKIFQQKCYSLIKNGGSARIDNRPNLFCTAIEHGTLLDRLLRMETKFPSKRKANNFISEHLLSSTLRRDHQKIKLKEYTIWSSWNNDNPAGPTFHYTKYDHADEVRANHGLDMLLKSKAIYLFSYKLPVGVDALRPTIADAGIYAYFEPPILSELNHGWTVPWHKNSRIQQYDVKPRPEVVHDSVYLEQIEFPVRKLIN